MTGAKTEPVEPTAIYSWAVDGLKAKFTDASTGSPDTYSWDFGDGETSTEKSPSHEYPVAGSFTVALRVENEAGINAFAQPIEVSEKRTAKGEKNAPNRVPGS